MSDSDHLYALPRLVTDLDQCWFYHTMDIPGYGEVRGQWDLRSGLNQYLGGIDFRNRRVLEIGTASGFLCFEMERRGAEVVACDLSEEQSWDVVPFALLDRDHIADYYRGLIRRLNNGYWLAHRAFGSRARVVYSRVYDLPEAIGTVDVATLCCVMLHLRDPFQALARALRHARQTAVVVDVLRTVVPQRPPIRSWRRRLAHWLAPDIAADAPTGSCPLMSFLPDPQTGTPSDTWWGISPELVRRWLQVLGFEDSTLTIHSQIFGGVPSPLYTIVAHRTKGQALAA